MYQAHIDAKNQEFIIEDRDGSIKLVMPFPSQKLQHLSADEQVRLNAENAEAWAQVRDLVKAANEGLNE